MLTGQAIQKWMFAEFNNNTKKLESINSSHEMKNLSKAMTEQRTTCCSNSVLATMETMSASTIILRGGSMVYSHSVYLPLYFLYSFFSKAFRPHYD
jgi:hypothetical protein